MDQFKKHIINISVQQLQPNPNQPRGIITPEVVMELSDSIKEHGVLEPLIVAHTPAGYQIIAGERRWRASKMAGLEKVPCIVKETTPKGMLEMTLVENVQREELNPIDRAKGFKNLKDQFGLSTTEIAKRIGKSLPFISNSLRLLLLPDAIKDGLLSELITEGHARALQTIENPKLMIEAYKMVLRETASVRKTEEIARRIRAKTGGLKPKRGRMTSFIVSEEIDRLRDNLKNSLGEKSKVKLVRTTRQTKLDIILLGSPEETNSELKKIYQALLNK